MRPSAAADSGVGPSAITPGKAGKWTAKHPSLASHLICIT